MAVTKRLRFEIFRRDNHACRYCGAAAPDVKLTVDHVTPTALGGNDKPENLVTACSDCNSGKTSSSPDAPVVDDVSQDAIRWAKALERAARQAMDKQIDAENYHDWFDDTWSKWGVGEGKDRRPLPRPDSWKRSVSAFMAAGLKLPLLDECVEIAMTTHRVAPSDKFRYMCGIAWKKITELQDAAREILSVAESDPDPDPDSELKVNARIRLAVFSHVVYAHHVNTALSGVVDGYTHLQVPVSSSA
jgi:HNH endonuclease